jgi:hypothetical protein
MSMTPPPTSGRGGLDAAQYPEVKAVKWRGQKLGKRRRFRGLVVKISDGLNQLEV